MKKHRIFHLFLLIFCGFWIPSHADPQIFEFTAPLYNLSIEENSIGSKYARSENATKIGVPLPEKEASCKFRVAEILGEKSSLFKTHSRQVGNFVFLRIRYKGDNPLNRELKDFYDILVKATCKRRDLSNLETTARVHLRVIDRNDASPVFLVDEQGYEAEIDDDLEPFSTVLQVEASDADIGINSAIYFSLLNRSHDFFVEPVSGWIRTLRHVKPDKYQLKVKAEDRASRLLYYDENEVQPSWTADVQITVRETKPKKTKVNVEVRKIKSGVVDGRQLAAIVTLNEAPKHASVGLRGLEMDTWFEVEKEENEDRWMVFTKPGARLLKKPNVTLTIGEDYIRNSGFATGRSRSVANSTTVIPIQFATEHSINLINGDTTITTDELSPIGRILAKFQAKVENPDDEKLVRFSIVSEGNGTLPFAINSKNGILRVNSSLATSTAGRSYKFMVTANLQGIPTAQNSSVLVSVSILDANNHAPVWAAKWMRQAPIPITTSHKPGDVVLKVDAIDQDEGENGHVVYKMTSEMENVPVRINATTGEISLVSSPGKSSTWPVTVWAVDRGVPMSRMSALNLIFYRNGTKIPAKPKPIIVQETENRHSPVFHSFPELVEVTEDAPIGTVVAKLVAMDEDTGYNGLIRYVIHDVANSQYEVFRVNETSGEVSVASDLSKIIKEKQEFTEVQMKVTAVDAGNPPKSSSKNMKIRIVDVNNHFPQFDEPSYHLRVTESEATGKKLLKVSASDADGGNNGKVTYSLANLDDETISIDKTSGIVTLKKTLDRESIDTHTFTIIASDGGVSKKLSFVNFTMQVDDVNDSPPKCVNLMTKVKIPEDLPHGAFVGCIAASDEDSGENAKLKFTLPSASSLPFRIDHHSGCIFVHVPETPMDFSKTSSYNLSVDVSDHGEPRLSTSCNLQIELINVLSSNAAIEFDDVAKEASVYENSEIGTEVIMIEAKEVTDEKNRIENIEYSIIGGDGWPFFSVDNKGTVRTTQMLDRETKSAYWITVQAEDSVAEKRSRRKAIVHVFIRILDRNDHRPMAKKSMYTATVPENSPANVVIVKVEATDADDVDNDSAAPLTFKIERGDPQSFFRIDLTSGYITTSGIRRLDREKQAEHELWVTICDGGEPQLCSNVIVVVTVTDENDNPPAFIQAIHHYNVRSQFVGQLCRIFAVDADEGNNSELFYNITEGDARFSIDQNGFISTSEAVHGDESYALTVQATDRGEIPQFAATRVILTAVGRSGKPKTKNSPPVVLGKKSDYVIPISDADQVGLTVGKLEATDEDGDDLWWSISSGDPQSVFDIRKDSGQLLLAKKVDYLTRGEHRLNVSVTDGTDWDHTTVIIQVSRQISQRPKFSASHYQTDVSERTAVGTQIYTLKATGETSGPGTKPLVYNLFSIDDVAMEDKIRVEPSSGNVIVMEPLDFETAPRVQAVVQVQQAGMRSFATLVVNVNDENDNAPYFVDNTAWVYVDENDQIDDLLTVVTAFDKDRGENGIVKYSIVSGNEDGHFSINPSTGELRLAKLIDRDHHVESILRIRASDSAANSLKDEMTMHIGNSNAAPEYVKFDRPLYQVSVYDYTPPGTPLVVLSVLHRGFVTYKLSENCTHFEVHSLSGAVHLSKWLTKETFKTVDCTAFVVGPNGDNDTTRISAKIIRTNQHSPVFQHEVYRGSIRENSPSGSPVLSVNHLPLVVSAIDEDSGPNGLVGYRVLSTDNDQFVVDKFTGAVRSLKPLDYEKQKEHHFYVQAFDMGQPSRESLMAALIIVSVVDENDEAPKFPSAHLESTVLLPTANGVLIGGQAAQDKDTVGRLRYIIKDPEANKMVEINKNSGEIFVKNSQILKPTTVEVFVSDGVRSDSYQLKLHVETPVKTQFRFTQMEYEGVVKENTTYPPGNVILSVSTIGETVPTPVTFTIVNPRPEFFIHPGTGVISATGVPVDRETTPLIQLVVQAKTIEKKTKTAQCLVTIRVEDVNDEVATFLNTPYDVTVNSETPIGTVILKIDALDRDEGKNAALKYSVAGIPDDFALNGSDIVVAKKLRAPEEFTFSIIVEDSGEPKQAAKETVKIRVVDNALPVFDQNVYIATVHKNHDKKTVLAKVFAKSNLNSGKRNGLIGYRIADDSKMFSVDFISGEVRVNGVLDEPEYSFHVEAVEVTRPKMVAKALVKVSVKSTESDGLTSITFPQDKYTVRVPESAPSGHCLLKINASSTDVDYTIANTDEIQQHFEIQRETGDVCISKSVDFESRQNFNIRVLASSGSAQSEVPLVVVIDDVNDEIPVFLNSEVVAQVDDSAIAGQFITIMSATDLDTVSSLPDGQKLLFRFIDGDETLFNIEHNSGKVTLARSVEPLDMSEGKTKKVMNVSVTDGIFTAYARLTVEIMRNGATQPPPRFEQSHYVASALENAKVNKSTLLTVSVKGGIAPLRYSLGAASSSSNGNSRDSWPISIDKKTGRIHVSRVLNFHQDKNYQIPLVVTDATKRRAFSTLSLSVIDINDKPPFFILPLYSTSVSESAKEGDTVLMVSATDEDENDVIEYSLLDGNGASFFHVHPRQGTVTVARKLEHKAGHTLSLTVKATDSANPPHHATTTVEINVASDTAKVPRFSNSHYLFAVQEDADVGNVIGRVQQMETEIDEVRFTIADPIQDLPFSVERSTGKIIVKSVLDRERRKRWKMTIRADAVGGVHTLTTVTIDVIDVNDNAPAFQGDYELLTISEDAAVGTSVTIFSATDKDESPSGKIRYSLVKNSPHFKMNEDSGWLTVSQPLNRETTALYELIARATDEGGFHTDLPFSISITDVNDSPPRFEKEEFHFDLHIPKSLESPITTFVITDEDLAPFNQSQLFILSGNEEGVFFLDNMDLRVKRPEIVAKKDKYILMMTAFDGMSQATSKVIVNVINKSGSEDATCPPSIADATVAERSKKGSLVLGESKLSSLPNVTFEMRDIAEHPFVMNFRNGIVKVKEMIDYEKRSKFEFTRATIRNGEVFCTEKITVRITNENDNHPVFAEKESSVSIDENLPTSEDERQYLTRVVATDTDEDELKYRLVDEFNSTFKIDETSGVITVVKVLDSEKLSSYQLQVIASDGKFEDKATVLVTVNDQNDNAPHFEKSTYSMKVMESESIGYQLAHIQATGGDVNETIEYSLKPSPHNNLVALDKATGVLTIARVLDFESVRQFKVTVIATDSGEPPLSSEATIEVSVMDENDNAPKFTQVKYIAKVKENSPVGTKVTRVEATDADAEHFGRVSYAITPSSSTSSDETSAPIPFVIDDNGEVRTNGDIDFETTKKYVLKVTARDGATPPQLSESLLEIQVEDENDHSPVFEDCNMTAVVQEGDPIGQPLLKFVITDADGPTNGGPFQVTLNGDGAKTFFKVNEELQMVTTKKIQHSKKDKFLLTVIAKDVKGRTSDCPLTVYIRQESRHAPSMKPMKIRVNTLLNEMKAGVIGRLRASDEDAEDLLKFGIVEGSTVGPLATLEYPKPQSNGKPHVFRVETSTGDVWADHSLTPGMHTFNVTVSDGKYTTVSYVEVFVSSIDSDVIDHAVSIRVRSMSVEEFMRLHVEKFRRVIAHHLNLNEDSIQLISVQNAPRRQRVRRSDDVGDVEILLTAQRGHGRGYLKPDHIYTRLKNDFESMKDQSDRMSYQLITEMCTTGACMRGECREQIELIEDEWTRVSTDTFSFVSPFHTRRAQCLCPDGFGGRRCELEVNACSKSPCEQWQMCVPSVRNNTYDCICPLGMEGDRCTQPSCKNSGKCLEEAELSVGGDGYFEISLSNEIETRMELEIEMKTTSTNGIIMWASGRHDYHKLLLINGTVEYHWDAGSGQGIVRSKTSIVDGQWHRIAISRRQRRARLTVDDSDVQESFSPVGSTVVNLQRFSQKILIGAKVVAEKKDEENGPLQVTDGVVACFRTISVDGMKVLKTRQGMKLYGAQPGCAALTSSPCSELPCNHGGTCHPHGRSFHCECPTRYTGDRCEVDQEPCASNPCPPGIQCIPFYNDYLCKCPNGFTGKHCESRGFEDIDPTSSSCSKNVCGATGQCISIPRHNPMSSDFICNCTGGNLQSTPCQEPSSFSFSAILEMFLKAEMVVVLLGVCFLLLVCCVAFISWRCCKRKQDPKYGAHCDVPHMRNTRVLVPVDPPPPLPPRGFRNDFGSTSANTTRPMVQVKPYSNAVDLRDSRSPSACGSSKGTRREASESSGNIRRDDDQMAFNRVRHSDRSSSRGDALAMLRESGHHNWRVEPSKSGRGAVVVGQTELMPVVNDDDYMTMKPRKDHHFMRDDEPEERKPQIPAHATPLASALYDDPISLNSQLFDDIDEEVNIHIS